MPAHFRPYPCGHLTSASLYPYFCSKISPTHEEEQLSYVLLHSGEPVLIATVRHLVILETTTAFSKEASILHSQSHSQGTMTAEPQSLIELWTRRGISAAGVATSFGFYTAKKSTQIGVSISHFDLHNGDHTLTHESLSSVSPVV